MKVVLIVAACKKSLAIGKNNDLLWRLPADMQFFKNTTLGFPVITGRKNYQSIPEKYRPLPGRENIVVTRSKDFLEEGIAVVHSLEEAILEAKKQLKEQCFIIGGGQIYQEALEKNIPDELYITWVDADLPADTYLKGFDARNWKEEVILHHLPDAKNQFEFTIVKYTRKFVA